MATVLRGEFNEFVAIYEGPDSPEARLATAVVGGDDSPCNNYGKAGRCWNAKLCSTGLACLDFFCYVCGNQSKEGPRQPTKRQIDALRKQEGLGGTDLRVRRYPTETFMHRIEREA